MSKVVTLDMNRVEGDLQLKLQLEGGVVTDAWTVGTSYRGFEQLMVGRAPLDSVVITPRVCGICSTAHLTAAVTALERAAQCPVPPNAVRVRNACQMAEELQSDARQTFLMFAIDLADPAYAGRPDYEAMVEAFAQSTGRVYRQCLSETKKLLEIVALFAGQWPHSSHMVPGGVVTRPNRRQLATARALLEGYVTWYEATVLGCSLERWGQVGSLDQLLAWVDEKPAHRDSALGRFVRFTRALGLQKLGLGEGNFLSYGAFLDPERWQPPFEGNPSLRPGGFRRAATKETAAVDHRQVKEHLRFSWFVDRAGTGAAHPFEGETIPAYAPESEKYTWAKAPRYADAVVETGALAQFFIAGDPLARSLVDAEGPNAFARQLLRLHRPASTIALLRATLEQLEAHLDEPFYLPPGPLPDQAQGYGLTEAARGSLGHWVQIADGKVARYQIVSPTSWNASPRDGQGRRGHWEQSMLGTHLADEAHPVELGHIIRSHDPCLVCTVHFLGTDRKLRVGGG